MRKKGGRGHKRGELAWKPFTSPLNAKSLGTALTIINSLMAYLVDAGYLQANPLRLVRKAKRQAHFEERKLEVQARILEQDEWEAMLNTLENMPEETPSEKNEKYRLKFIVALLFFLGLRVGELTSHTWEAFKQIEGRWWFIVKGKGSKWGKIPVNNQLLDSIIQFRQHLKLTPLPQPEEAFPLVPSWRSSQGLTARHINNLLKEWAIKTVQTYFRNNKQKMTKLSKFSAHWLRHLSATMQDRAGIPLAHIQANHRHNNNVTTRLYIHTDDKERSNKINALKII